MGVLAFKKTLNKSNICKGFETTQVWPGLLWNARCNLTCNLWKQQCLNMKLWISKLKKYQMNTLVTLSPMLAISICGN